MDPYFLLRAGIDPHGSIPRDYLTEGGITKCILLESLSKKNLVGLFYTLEYIRAMIPKGHIEDESLNLLRVKVESDLKEVATEIILYLSVGYAYYIKYHTTAGPFVGSLLYSLIGQSGKKSIQVYVEVVTPKVEEYFHYHSRSYTTKYRIKARDNEFAKKHLPKLKEEMKIWEWAGLPRLKFSKWNEDIAKVALMGGFFFNRIVAGKDSDEVASDHKFCKEFLTIFSYAIYGRQVAPRGGSRFATIMQAYWDYFEHIKWSNTSLDEKIVMINHTINIAHFTGGMVERVFPSISNPIAFLDKMSSLDDYLPDGKDFKTLSHIYNNWSKWI